MPTPISTALALVTFCAACGAIVPGDEPTLDPRVTVLPDTPGMTITPGTISIPRNGNEELTALAVGDILVSAQGEGFLRSIEAVGGSAGTIVFTTRDAELGDALIDAAITASLGGQGKADTHQLPSVRFTIDDLPILDNAAITARIVQASLGFEPELDLDLAIEDRRLANFEMVLRGRITGSIDLEVDAKDIAVGPEIRLWESPPAVFYQQVGFLPVVETVTVSVVLKLDAVARGHGRVRIDASALANLAGGIRYTRAGGWDGVAELGLSVDGSVSEASLGLDELGVRAWLAARADVRIYGLAGPYIAAGPQVEIVHDLASGELDASAGFAGRTGGGFKLFRLNVPTMPSFELFDVLRALD